VATSLHYVGHPFMPRISSSQIVVALKKRVRHLVLRSRKAARHQMLKLSPNWEGPYRVTRVIEKGAYHLEELNGNPLPNSWNIANLKLYHSRADVLFLNAKEK